jgi:micrococcal nuclease
MYEYKCQLIRVIDGNTVEADIDLGFNVRIKQKIKLYGVEATNNHQADKTIVDEERARLKALLPREFLVQTILSKRGKIGRCLGVIYVETADDTRININEELINRGLAKKFST